MRRTVIIALALLGCGLSGTLAAGPALAQGGACGWYVILGCSRSQGDAFQTFNRLGGPGMGGGAGAQVVNTNDYPNFRNGWWCVTDGPYATRGDAEGIPWREAVPDAYVKSAC